MASDSSPSAREAAKTPAPAEAASEERVRDLQQRLDEALHTLDAIQNGSVDAVVVNGPRGAQIFTLESPDHPFRTFVEGMQEGALTLAGDGQADSVIVNGTDDDDIAVVAGDPSGAFVWGLTATVNITGADAALDRLFINTLGGADAVDASALQANVIGLTLDGGNHDDVLIGSAGDDVLLGGAGDDVLIGGPGLDSADGGTGNNTVIP